MLRTIGAIANMLQPMFLGFAAGTAISGNMKLALALATVGIVCTYLSRFKPGQKLFELYPLETLYPYIEQQRSKAMEKFGSVINLRTEPELKSLISGLGECNVEVVWRIKARRIAHGSVRHYDAGSRVRASAHIDLCGGWGSKPLSAESGCEALIVTEGEVSKVRAVEAAWRRDWRQTVWMAEHAEGKWFHIKREIGYFDDDGGHFLALFHFYITPKGGDG